MRKTLWDGESTIHMNNKNYLLVYTIRVLMKFLSLKIAMNMIHTPIYYYYSKQLILKTKKTQSTNTYNKYINLLYYELLLNLLYITHKILH